jgi:hypothetical protein
MIVGAVLYFTSGTDLDAALADGTMAAYLEDAAGAQRQLFANLSVWLIGAIGLGVAGHSLAARTPHPASTIASQIYTVGAGLAAMAFIAWMSLIRLAGLGSADVGLAEAIGFVASRADWAATVMLIGFGPLLIAVGGAGSWVPRWLLIWSFLAAVAGTLAIVSLYTNETGTYGMLEVPVGLGWMLAAGAVAMRHRDA